MVFRFFSQSHVRIYLLKCILYLLYSYNTYINIPTVVFSTVIKKTFHRITNFVLLKLYLDISVMREVYVYMYVQCFGSESGWIRIQFGPESMFGIRIRIPDPDV
jgi:hypothetical protein